MIRIFLAALLLIPALLYGQNLQKATFAAGCFWCTEEAFDKLPGVVSTTSGYMGGQKKHPTYEEVSAGITGPAEDYHQDYYKKNPVRYRFYGTGCGRYDRLDQLWGALRKK